MTAPICTSCGVASRLTNGQEVYPHRPDLYSKSIYVCDDCGGRVGCHPGTTSAVGTPANALLRKERSKVHRLIDPIWKHAHKSHCYNKDMDRRAMRAVKSKTRTRVYAFIASKMSLTASQTHVGMFNEEQCARAREAVRGTTYADIRNWHIEQNEGVEA